MQENSSASTAVSAQNNSSTDVSVRHLDLPEISMLQETSTSVAISVQENSSTDFSVKLPVVGPCDLGALKSTLTLSSTSDEDKYKLLKNLHRMKDSNYEDCNLLGS